MTILLDDVRVEFELLNDTLDNAVELWSEFQKPIPTNYETTTRMFAPNPEWHWVMDAYHTWVTTTDDELVRIANSYGFKYDTDNDRFKHGVLSQLVESSLNKLRLYYNYDVIGGNRSLETVLENVAVDKFSLTKDDMYSFDVLKYTLNMCYSARANINKVFKIDDMRNAYTECKTVIDGSVKRCAKHMRPIYQHDFEFIMSEVESFQKYDGSDDMVRKIMEKTNNGDFDSWYDGMVACYGSVDEIHDLELEMKYLADELGVSDWWTLG